VVCTGARGSFLTCPIPPEAPATTADPLVLSSELPCCQMQHTGFDSHDCEVFDERASICSASIAGRCYPAVASVFASQREEGQDDTYLFVNV
jgi:hypothetical protein